MQHQSIRLDKLLLRNDLAIRRAFINGRRKARITHFPEYLENSWEALGAHSCPETLGSARHSHNFGVSSRPLPEFEQNDLAARKFQIFRALGAIVEDVFVEEEVETVERNAEPVGCLLLGKEFLLCGADHSMYVPRKKVCTCSEVAGESGKLPMYPPL